MAKQTLAYLKEKFETGDTPIGQDFVDLIDTLMEETIHILDPLTTGMNITYNYLDVADEGSLPLPAAANEFARLLDGTSFVSYLDSTSTLVWLNCGVRDFSLPPYVIGTNQETIVQIRSASATRIPCFIHFPSNTGFGAGACSWMTNQTVVTIRGDRKHDIQIVATLASYTGSSMDLGGTPFAPYCAAIGASKGYCVYPGRAPVRFTAHMYEDGSSLTWAIVDIATAFNSSVEAFDFPDGNIGNNYNINYNYVNYEASDRSGTDRLVIVPGWGNRVDSSDSKLLRYSLSKNSLLRLRKLANLNNGDSDLGSPQNCDDLHTHTSKIPDPINVDSDRTITKGNAYDLTFSSGSMFTLTIDVADTYNIGDTFKFTVNALYQVVTRIIFPPFHFMDSTAKTVTDMIQTTPGYYLDEISGQYYLILGDMNVTNFTLMCLNSGTTVTWGLFYDGIMNRYAGSQNIDQIKYLRLLQGQLSWGTDEPINMYYNPTGVSVETLQVQQNGYLIRGHYIGASNITADVHFDIPGPVLDDGTISQDFTVVLEASAYNYYFDNVMMPAGALTPITVTSGVTIVRLILLGAKGKWAAVSITNVID